LKQDPTGAGAIGLESRIQDAVGEAYRVLRELGGGGMSRVFLAEETRLSRQVVVKVLPSEMGAGANAERFEREIRLAARLQHPHRRAAPHGRRGGRPPLLHHAVHHGRVAPGATGTRGGAAAVPEGVRYYERFVELWKDADPELQPAVREVRVRLAQLAQEPGA
jgi:serine/threonine protein kinase